MMEFDKSTVDEEDLQGRSPLHAAIEFAQHEACHSLQAPLASAV